jgi:menaquinone-dependent protoporphyrinogen oxidase
MSGEHVAPCLHRSFSMTSVLIVYSTGWGQTRKVAQRIAQAITAAGHSAEMVDADRPVAGLNVERFDRAVIAAPIHAGGYPRSILRFVRDNRAFLERVPSAFLSVGLAIQSRTSDGRAETMAVVEKFVQRSGWRPRRIELVAGALPYTKYNFLIRFVMRRIVARAGGETDTSRDYEYTDWEAVNRFARSLVDDAPATSSDVEQQLTPGLHVARQ